MNDPVMEVLLGNDLWPIISQFQQGIRDDMKVFTRWTPPLLRSQSQCPPGTTYFEIIHDGLDPWYSLHGIESLEKVINCLPKMETIALVEATYSGRIGVLEWFHTTRRLDQFDLPLMSIAAWHGQLHVVRFLDHVMYPGCSRRATKWALRNNHTEVINYLAHRAKTHQGTCKCHAE